MSTELVKLAPLADCEASTGDQLVQKPATSARTYLSQLVASDFLRKVAETYATQIVLLALSLLTSVAVARALGPQGRGLYAVAMAMGIIGVQFGNLGLHASNTYYLAQNRSLLPQLVGNSLAVSLGLGGMLAICALGIFSLWPRLAPLEGGLLWMGLAWIPIGLAFLLMENLLLGLQDVRSYNKVETLNRALALTLIGSLIFLHRTTAQSVFVATLFALLLSVGWTVRLLWHRVNLFPEPSLSLLWSHLQIGIRAYLIALFGYLLLRIDLLMVKYLLGAEQAGYYSIASTMGDYILMLPTVIGLILFPRLSALTKHREKFSEAIKVSIGTAMALIPILAFSGLAARPVVHILFGKAFLPAVGAFLWLLPGLFAMGVEITLVQCLNSVGYPRIVVWIWLLSTLLNIALNFWAIPRFGIAGASMVSSVSYSLVFAAVLLVIRRDYRTVRL